MSEPFSCICSLACPGKRLRQAEKSAQKLIFAPTNQLRGSDGP